LTRLDLLTPLGAIVALALTVPLALLLLATRRGERARRALALPSLGLRSVAGPAVALALVCGLVAAAAAQPVLRSRETARVRTDAAAWVVVDTSRSMLARPGPGRESRIVRARRAALRFRAALADVPVGIASVNDRVLPHLLPSPDRQSFAATIARTIRPGYPPPAGAGRSGTNLTALASVPTLNYFEPSHRRRVALVLTDAESEPLEAGALDEAYRAEPPTKLVVVRLGGSGERVYDERGRTEPAYEPRLGAEGTARELAAVTGGRAFAEDELDAATDAALAALGRGVEGVPVGRGEKRRPLAPFLVGLSALPLAWLVRRRNFP
jgi:hypothetical protein